MTSKDTFTNGHLTGKIDVTPTASGGTKTVASDISYRDPLGFDSATIRSVTVRDEHNNVISYDDRKK